MTIMYISVALLLAFGLTGALVQIWPSTPFILTGILIWALYLGGYTAWTFFTLSTILLLLAQILKILIPGKQLKKAGIPTSTLLLGGAGAILGFFIIPIIGLPAGFILGIGLAEYQRLKNPQEAKKSLLKTLKATGISVLIEFSISFLIVTSWAVTSLLISTP
ncbi:DUF456 domain-containing protein [Gleimia sp. 6138-11-ORH1]|uniref:DUF456 domain-containing protein n=1 Tax=Gleimia sp. 6138-11-ORH1 TaxID=2973937 RepID=UPI002168ED05|nr:DUF456 domain-containing protein [Gleimia sp. 6138-11-ORH1]MCS4483919.1 DUF456 domain-containing protein [Gleimia sp. 6138-11-ORH1]